MAGATIGPLCSSSVVKRSKHAIQAKTLSIAQPKAEYEVRRDPTPQRVEPGSPPNPSPGLE